MIEEGNPDMVQDLINFKKRDMIYQVIEKVLRYQQVRALFCFVYSLDVVSKKDPTQFKLIFVNVGY